VQIIDAISEQAVMVAIGLVAADEASRERAGFNGLLRLLSVIVLPSMLLI